MDEATARLVILPIALVGFCVWAFSLSAALRLRRRAGERTWHKCGSPVVVEGAPDDVLNEIGRNIDTGGLAAFGASVQIRKEGQSLNFTVEGRSAGSKVFSGVKGRFIANPSLGQKTEVTFEIDVSASERRASGWALGIILLGGLPAVLLLPALLLF